MAKKLSPEQKKLKKLFSENGGLLVLGNEIQTVLKDYSGKDEVFASLEKFLVAVTKFQDQNHSKMDKFKASFKNNEAIMLHLRPLHNHIKECGRDVWKTENHKTFVKNKAGISKKNRFSRKFNYEEVNEFKIFLRNDYYDSPTRLSYINQEKRRKTSPLNQAMIVSLKDKVKKFLIENANAISSNIEELKTLVHYDKF